MEQKEIENKSIQVGLTEDYVKLVRDIKTTGKYHSDTGVIQQAIIRMHKQLFNNN